MATITLTWKDLNIGEDGFNIYRSESPMDINNMPTPIATVGANVGSYDDTTGVDGAVYYYRIGVIKNGVEKISSEVGKVFGNTVNVHDVFVDGSTVATFKFDGDATDLGGVHHGTWYGTESYTTGKVGQAGRFNGSSYVDIGTSTTLGIPSFTQGISVSFWAKTPDTTGGYQTIIASGNDAQFQIRYRGDSNTMATLLYDSSGTMKRLGATFQPTPNEWFFMVSTYDYSSGVLTHYVNGNDVLEQMTTNGGIAQGDYSVRIGHRFAGNYWNGDIDHLRIFNRPLTASEVGHLYNER